MNKSVVVNGTKFVPLRHIAVGQAYINPEDLDKLLKWIDETNRDTKIYRGDDYTHSVEHFNDIANGRDDCPTCGRSQCFGGSVCFSMASKTS